MKTLKIDTGKGQVTLTYSEEAQKWDYFSGSHEAFNMIDEMCLELGWEYDPKLKNYQVNFVAENADKFVVDAEENQTTGQLWSDDKTNEMNYEEFKSAYTEAFNNSMKYSPNEVGSTFYTNKMVDLADDYPELLERLEIEFDKLEISK